MDNYIIDLYGKDIDSIHLKNDADRFVIENDTGRGIITNYHICDGLDITFNDIQMDYYEGNFEFKADIIEINHCKDGRCEYEIDSNTVAFVSRGDLSISNTIDNTGISYFPTKLYRGISLYIDIEKIQNSRLIKEFDINLSKIASLAKGGNVKIFRSNERLEHIFYEFYNAQKYFLKEYLKVKSIELLLFVSNIDWDNEIKNTSFLNKKQLYKIKKVRNFILKNLENHYTIEQLSKKFDISESSLKNQFKKLYGQSIYSYTKKLRLEKSKTLLLKGEMSITQIALESGYENPAKFSSAFKKEFGVIPSKFQT